MHRRRQCGWFLAVAALLASGIVGLDATSAALNAEERPVGEASSHWPQRQGKRLLAHPRPGRGAMQELGSNIAAAAKVNRISEAHLRRLLAQDPAVWVGRDGKIFYVEQGAAAMQGFGRADAAAAVGDAPPWAIAPMDQTFSLHGKPGSDHAIYLNFVGHTVGPSDWWVTNGGMSPASYGGFSLDDSPNFTDAELEYIQTVWRIVAEKFAPFDVDVTTEAVSGDAVTRLDGADTTWGTIAAITSDMAARGSACTASPSGGCVGIARINVFDEIEPAPNFNEPAWAYTKFTADSDSMPAQQVADVVAHEVGHTFGLEHDGVIGGSAYYGGAGNWFPIMGSSVLAVGQFSRGSYPGANNQQDDLAAIADGGAPLRTDTIGDASVGAAVLGARESYALEGIIETATDKDVFRVDRTCTGDFSTVAEGIGRGQALDIKVSVLDDTGMVKSTSDPPSAQDEAYWPYVPTGLNAETTISAGPGRYLIQVEGVGSGSFTTGGYDDYGSVGQYHLSVSGCAGATSILARPAGLENATSRWRWAQATLGWSKVAGATGYRLTIGKSGSSTRKARTVGNVSSATFAVLSPSTTYTFDVQALGQSGVTSPVSSRVAIKTAARPTDRPSNIRGMAKSSSTLTLSWLKNVPSISKYSVSIGPAGQAHTGKLIRTTLPYKFTGLRRNTVYTVAVRGVKSDGSKTPPSEIYAVTTTP